MTRLTASVVAAVNALSATAALAADGGYLFVTFKGEQTPMTEQVYFGLSQDGRQWASLNDGKPVLVSQLGEKGVRDPYLLRGHAPNQFFLIATDLSINLTRHDWGRAVTRGSKSIVVWESSDLVNWSEPRLVKVAPDDAGCTWAPEAVYDEEQGDYLVFWASKTGRDDFKKHRIWAARTKDFKTFGEPFIYIDRPTDIIDTSIVHENGTYYRFSKDEQFKDITMERSAKLDGPWANVEGFTLAKMTGYEGPACFQLDPSKREPGKPGQWCLVLDFYSRGEGYKPWVTSDLATGKFEKAEQGFTFPYRFRHGSVLTLTAEEYARVQQAYAGKQAPQVSESK